jgi:hypothetical protein
MNRHRVSGIGFQVNTAIGEPFRALARRCLGGTSEMACGDTDARGSDVSMLEKLKPEA